MQNLYCDKFTYSGKIEGLQGNNSPYIGGVLGGQYSPEINVSNANIDIVIKGAVCYGGGIVGYLSSGTTNITDCIVKCRYKRYLWKWWCSWLS